MEQEKQGCLAVVLKLFGIDISRPNECAADEQLPFRLRDQFLSAAELSYFHVLRGVIGAQYQIAMKVRVSDLLYVVRRGSNLKYANRIDRKHVDFVLCDLKTLQPRLAIELDDSSHTRPDRAERDALIDAAFDAAGLPLMHVVAKRAYSPQEVAQSVNSAISEFQVPQAPIAACGSTSPICPRCNMPMVERQARKGQHNGKRFWACPSYPECREIIAID